MKILAPVYNPIEFDGRVQRASQALSAIGEVVVLSIASGADYVVEHFVNIRVPLPLRPTSPLAHLWFWLRLWRTALAIRPRVVHAHDFFMAFPGWVAAKLTGAQLVYDAHELIIPESGVPMSWRDRFWYILERWTVKRANLIIAANSQRAQLMKEHYRLPAVPVVIRNIPPAPLPSMPDGDILRRHPALGRRDEDECLIVYQGDVSIARGLGEFIAAVGLLPDRFRMIIVGDGPDADLLRRDVKTRNLEHRISFIGRVPRDNLFDILRQCDIGIVAYPTRGLNNIFCAPNKVFEYAQAGLVLLCWANPVLESLLANYNIGLVAQAPADIAAALQRLHKDRAVFRSEIDRFLRDHPWEEEAARLREAYESLSAG